MYTVNNLYNDLLYCKMFSSIMFLMSFEVEFGITYKLSSPYVAPTIKQFDKST